MAMDEEMLDLLAYELGYGGSGIAGLAGKHARNNGGGRNKLHRILEMRPKHERERRIGKPGGVEVPLPKGVKKNRLGLPGREETG